MKQSFLVVVFLILLVSTIAQAQEIVKSFSASTFGSKELDSLKVNYGINKIIPAVYETQILIALSYFPELKNTNIEFRLKKTNTPLSSKPTLPGLLQSAKKRKYIITISEETNPALEPILFKKLNFNAQVGVLGHELSHVSDYLTKGFSKMMNLVLIEIFSKKQVDQFESRTDHICINHGLGFQLLDWSKSVRENLKIDYWRGADNLKHKTSDERYLNPETIIQIMKQNQLYHKTLNYN
ncbi:MAG: hypothetical protein WAM46_06720 [Flavobacterium sp.]